MKRSMMWALLIALAPTHSAAAIPADQANRIQSQAKLVKLQSANRANIEEALNAVGPPDYVVEAKNYKNIAALRLAEGSAVSLIWAHEGCVLSLLTFDKNKRGVGGVIPGINYSANDPWLSCPDVSFANDTRQLSKFSCRSPKPHKYCRVARRDGVRDTTIDREALKASAGHQAKVKAQFSSWDGSHTNLVKRIKSGMHDPGSYEHVETYYLDRGDHLVVTTKFRGKNVFGALMLNTVQAKVDINGRVLALSPL